MDVLAILNSNGTIPINIALIVVQFVLIKTSISSVARDFEEHKKVVNTNISEIESKMARNDEIFYKLRDDMTKVLTTLSFIQEALKDLKEKKR